MTEEEKIGSSAVEHTLQPHEAQESHERIAVPSIEEVLLAKAGLATLMETFPQEKATPEVSKVIEIAAERVAEMENQLNKARIEAGFPSLNDLVRKMGQPAESAKEFYPDTSGNLSSTPAQAESTAGRLV